MINMMGHDMSRTCSYVYGVPAQRCINFATYETDRCMHHQTVSQENEMDARCVAVYSNGNRCTARRVRPSSNCSGHGGRVGTFFPLPIPLAKPQVKLVTRTCRALTL